MLDVRVIPFLVSELRLTPDEQELLQREWWPSYAHAVVHRDGVFLFDNGVGFGNAEVESTFSPRVTAIEDALARHGISLADVTGGDPGITESLGRMCKEEGPEKASRSSEADLLEYVTGRRPPSLLSRGTRSQGRRRAQAPAAGVRVLRPRR